MPAKDQVDDSAAIDGLVQMSFTVVALLNRVAAAHDLSLTQLRVLAILRDREPRMAELAAYLGLDRSSVSGLIDRAVTRGLVRRAASDDDGRSVRVGLTDEGHRLAATGAAEVADLLQPLLGKLGSPDRRRLTGLLSRLLG